MTGDFGRGEIAHDGEIPAFLRGLHGFSTGRLFV
jgi:hypothetical protein